MLDPTAGIWMTEDPIGFDAGDPNLRRYVGNNATSRTDRNGLQEKPVASTPIEVVVTVPKDWKGFADDGDRQLTLPKEFVDFLDREYRASYNPILGAAIGGAMPRSGPSSVLSEQGGIILMRPEGDSVKLVIRKGRVGDKPGRYDHIQEAIKQKKDDEVVLGAWHTHPYTLREDPKNAGGGPSAADLDGWYSAGGIKYSIVVDEHSIYVLQRRGEKILPFNTDFIKLRKLYDRAFEFIKDRSFELKIDAGILAVLREYGGFYYKSTRNYPLHKPPSDRPNVLNLTTKVDD